SIYPMRPSRGSVVARAILDRVVVHVPDVHDDPEAPEASRRLARTVGYRSILGVPMLREGSPIGAIGVGRSDPNGNGRPFSDREIALLKTFADQAVIAIENVRLFQELETRNRDLTEALEQQTATAEILRVISSSPTDVQPVFDTIGERAKRLCGADISLVSRVDGELIHLTSLHGVATEGLEMLRRAFPMPRSAETVMARAVRTSAGAHD